MKTIFNRGFDEHCRALLRRACLLSALIMSSSAIADTIEIRIDNRYDDVEEQISNGDISTNSSDLELGVDSGEATSVGLRFSDILIPRYSTITSAFIQFQTDETKGDYGDTFTIKIQDTDNAAPFTSQYYSVSSRSWVTDQVATWLPPRWTSKGEQGPDQRTNDLAAMIQAIINREDWQEGNALAFGIEGNGIRVAESQRGDPSGAPMLHIEYESYLDQIPPTSVGNLVAKSSANQVVLLWSPAQDNVLVSGYKIVRNDGIIHTSTKSSYTDDGVLADTDYTYQVLAIDAAGNESTNNPIVSVTTLAPEFPTTHSSYAITAETNDAEEDNKDADINTPEAVGRGSIDLDLGRDGADLNVSALRFELTIPRNSKILGAYLQFTARRSNDEETTLNVHFQDSGNAPPFSRDAGDITGRILSTSMNSVAWQPAPWGEGASGEDQRTPDLSPLLQQIINRNDWQSGNAVAIIVEGEGKRVARSFDDYDTSTEVLDPPRLVIDYVSSGFVADVQSPEVPQNVIILMDEHSSYPLISWDAAVDNSGNAVTYKIYRDDTMIAEVSDTQYLDTTAIAGETYSYHVTAADSEGNESGYWGSPISIDIPPIPTIDDSSPTVPGNLQAVNVGQSVHLDWDASTDDVAISHYVVYRDGIAIDTSTTVSFSDDTVALSTSYSYQVSAVDTANKESGKSPLVTITSLAQSALPVELLRKPYLQKATHNSMTIAWRTSLPTDSVVNYGLTSDNLTDSVSVTDLVTDHWVTVGNLLPDTTYYYAVTSSGATMPLAGGDSHHYFKTSPMPGHARDSRIWVLGDSGTANQNAENVRNAFIAESLRSGTPDMVLMLGDNAYDDGTDQEYQAAVFDIYSDTLRNTPLWSTLGNHDAKSASTEDQTGPYYDIFEFPKQGEAGGLASGSEAYYSFDYGNIHFVVLDSQDSDTSPDSPMLVWLENDLADTNQHWIVAFWHHPPYSKGSHDSDNESKLRNMRINALPILERAGVDLVLSGHSHSYERSYLIDGHYGDSDTFFDIDAQGKYLYVKDQGSGNVNIDSAYIKGEGANEGSVYIVAGSSGKKSSAPLNHPAMYTSQKALGSVILDINDNQMEVYFLTDSGQFTDSFTVIKSDTAASNAAPVANIVAADSGIIGENFTFDGTGSVDPDGQINQWLWDFGDGTTATGSVVNHSYTESGVYDVTLTVKDNGQPYPRTSMAFATVTAINSDGSITITTAINGKYDDVEEEMNSGDVSRASIDLDFVSNNLVGLRFTNVDIPKNASIQNASIQFKADSSDSVATLLSVCVEDSANATTFQNEPGDVSQRSCVGNVNWSPEAWQDDDIAEPQKLTGLATLLQMVVNKPNWTEGNAVVFQISGNGERAASTFERGYATQLEVRYLPYQAIDDTNSPSTPDMLQSTDANNFEVTLQWNASTDDNGVISHYNVYRDGELVGNAAGTEYIDRHLVLNTSYIYRVSAVDPSGNESSLSQNLVVSTTNNTLPAGDHLFTGFVNMPTASGLIGAPFGYRTLPDSFVDYGEKFFIAGSNLSVRNSDGSHGEGIIEGSIGKRKVDFHPGIDLPTGADVPTYAVAPGEVLVAGTKSGITGGVIWVDSGISEDGYRVIVVYRHVDPNKIDTSRIYEGAQVAAGDILSNGSEIDSATWYHTHLEVRKVTPGTLGSQRDSVNPMAFVAGTINSDPVSVEFSGFKDIGSGKYRIQLKMNEIGDQLDLNKFDIVLKDSLTNEVLGRYALDENAWMKSYDLLGNWHDLHFNPDNASPKFDKVTVVPMRYDNDGSNYRDDAIFNTYFTIETALPFDAKLLMTTNDLFGNTRTSEIIFSPGSVDADGDGIPDNYSESVY